MMDPVKLFDSILWTCLFIMVPLLVCAIAYILFVIFNPKE